MTTKKKTNKSIESSREAPEDRKVSNTDIVVRVLNEAQIRVLTGKTPAYAIKTRVGGGGREFRYVSHGYVTDMLNKAFGFDWDFKLLPVFDGSIAKHITVKTGENRKGEDILTHYITVYGELTVKIHNPKTGAIVAQITKPGPGSSIWFPANEWGDALKSAKSDGLKVAAHELGIALDLYWDDEAEFQKFETKNSDSEIIDALEEKDIVPNSIASAISQAAAQFGYNLDKMKSILGDNFMKDYKVEMWEVLKRHYEREKNEKGDNTSDK
jgi:hypothetical protein